MERYCGGTPIKTRVYGLWATPAYKDDSVFVTSGGSTGGGSHVYRIDADDGEKEWDFRFPGVKVLLTVVPRLQAERSMPGTGMDAATTA